MMCFLVVNMALEPVFLDCTVFGWVRPINFGHQIWTVQTKFGLLTVDHPDHFLTQTKNFITNLLLNPIYLPTANVNGAFPVQPTANPKQTCHIVHSIQIRITVHYMTSCSKHVIM